jgi:uncharacterized protein
MSEPTNTDVVQQGYEALGRGDIPAILDLLTDDVEWIHQGPSVIPFAGTRHGHEGVAQYFSLLDENLEFEQFEPREFVAQGDTVVVVGFERSVSKATGHITSRSFLFALIHLSAWNRHSANFAFWVFSEVRTG